MKDESATLEYPDASIEARGTMIPCRLKLSDQGISFRNSKTGKVETITPSDISVLNWQRLAGNYGLRVFTDNGNLYRFGGFKESEQSKLEKFFKSTYDKKMSEKEFSVKGWNYGAAKFEGASLSFDIGSMSAFEIPLNHVSGCTTGKNEVTLEFHTHDDASINLLEMRFHLPASENAGEDPVEVFQQRVMSKASVITATGDALAIFREVQCLTPRGRYDIKVYPSFIQLHGKTFDFKIPITTVLRLFLMPHMDQRQHFFVVSLDPPIKQGQTRYPYLILLFNTEDEDQIELPLTEDELQEKYEGRLEKEMSGAQFEILSKLFKGLCNRKIVTPGNFLGHSGTPAISCSYKAAAGYLYPLERGLIYVHKPPIHLRADEISSVNFARSGSTTRSFDFEVELKTGAIHTFSSIDKGEYNKLFEYINDKKIRIKNRGKMEMGGKADDFNDSDADEPDPYMRRVKQEAQERDDDDDEDSSEDEDFAPGEEGSDVAEEYDSYADDSSDSDDSDAGSGSDAERKKKKKKEKKQKAKTISENPRKPRKPKKPRDENKPKRPQSAYFLWLNDNREKIKKENPGITITEISKVAGAKWREIDPDEKKEYEEKHAVAKAEYDELVKGIKGKDDNRPKRPQSAYFLWLNDSREDIKKENPGISITEISKLAGQKWKEVTDEEKKVWDGKAAEAKVKYEEAMKEYIAAGGTASSGKKSKASPKKKSEGASPSKAVSSAAVGGGGGGGGAGYKSKEYIEDSSSDEGSDDDDKPLKKKTKVEAKKEKAESEEEEEEEEEEMSTDASGEDSD